MITLRKPRFMGSVFGAKVAQARRKGTNYSALDGRFTHKG